MKGLSIISVVIIHIFYSGFSDNCSHIVPIMKSIGAIMLPLFYVVTGILMKYKNNLDNFSLKKIFKKNLKGIIYPYCIFSILSILYYVARIVFFNASFEKIFDIIFVTVTFIGYSALWFLPSFFVSKILFVLLLKRKFNKYVCLLFFVGLSILFSLIVGRFCGGYAVINSYKYIWIYVIGRIFYGLAFMFIGYIGFDLFNNSRLKFILKGNISLIFCALVLPLYCILVQKIGDCDLHYSIESRPVLFYIASILGVFSVTVICYHIKKCRFVEFFGKNSLIIFATHLNLGIVDYSTYLARNIINNNYLCLFISVVLCLTFEFIIVLLIKNFLYFIIKV